MQKRLISLALILSMLIPNTLAFDSYIQPGSGEATPGSGTSATGGSAYSSPTSSDNGPGLLVHVEQSSEYYIPEMGIDEATGNPALSFTEASKIAVASQWATKFPNTDPNTGTQTGIYLIPGWSSSEGAPYAINLSSGHSCYEVKAHYFQTDTVVTTNWRGYVAFDNYLADGEIPSNYWQSDIAALDTAVQSYGVANLFSPLDTTKGFVTSDDVTALNARIKAFTGASSGYNFYTGTTDTSVHDFLYYCGFIAYVIGGLPDATERAQLSATLDSITQAWFAGEPFKPLMVTAELIVATEFDDDGAMRVWWTPQQCLQAVTGRKINNNDPAANPGSDGIETLDNLIYAGVSANNSSGGLTMYGTYSGGTWRSYGGTGFTLPTFGYIFRSSEDASGLYGFGVWGMGTDPASPAIPQDFEPGSVGIEVVESSLIKGVGTYADNVEVKVTLDFSSSFTSYISYLKELSPVEGYINVFLKSNDPENSISTEDATGLIEAVRGYAGDGATPADTDLNTAVIPSVYEAAAGLNAVSSNVEITNSITGAIPGANIEYYSSESRIRIVITDYEAFYQNLGVSSSITFTGTYPITGTLDSESDASQNWFLGNATCQLPAITSDTSSSAYLTPKYFENRDRYDYVNVSAVNMEQPYYSSDVQYNYAELKQGTVLSTGGGSSEEFNSMTGTPTYSGHYYQYFAVGGSEFVVDFVGEYVENQTITRNLTFQFSTTTCDESTLPFEELDTPSVHMSAYPHKVTTNDLTIPVTYTNISYIDITKVYVWKLSEAKLDGTVELLATDEVTATIQNNATSLFSNVADTDTAADGRIVYDFQPTGLDAYTFPTITTSDSCDSYGADNLASVQSKLLAASAAATVVSDYIILRTTDGDQAIMYNEYRVGEGVTLGSLIDSSSATNPGAIMGTTASTITMSMDNVVATPPSYDAMWTNNPTTSIGSGLTNSGITYGGYNGNYSSMDTKYQSSGQGSNIDITSTIAYTNPSGAFTPAEATPTQKLLLMNDSLVIDDSTINGEYIVGTATVFYECVLAYGSTPAYPNAIQSEFDNRSGFTQIATYSPTHTKINDVVVYNPVSVQEAMVVSLPDERDQRTTISQTSPIIPTALCPGDATCSHLICTCTVTEHLHTEDCYQLVETVVTTPFENTTDTSTPEDMGGDITTGGSLEYTYTGAVQEVYLDPGTYRLETWGAQGGGSQVDGNSYNGIGGKGGYAAGTITLTEATTLYIYVGGEGGASDYGISTTGWNGGGIAWSSSFAEPANSGGGATDIRLADDLYSRILVAGGGGGAGDEKETGGYGGGTEGYGEESAAGTQTGTSDGGAFGLGANTSYDGGAGGGGWYGGGTKAGTQTIPTSNSTNDAGAGSGGSGYVLTESSYRPSGYTVSSDYNMLYATLVDGSSSMVDPDGSLVVGHEGDGYAKITKLSADITSLETSMVQEFSYTGEEQFTTLLPGTYTVELWGAAGGDSNYKLGAHGMYVTTEIQVTDTSLVYVYVGGQGTSDTTYDGGWNGGANTYAYGDVSQAGGGGATDLRLGTAELDDRIVVAAGGGGAGRSYNGIDEGKSNSDLLTGDTPTAYYYGGGGGGYEGGYAKSQSKGAYSGTSYAYGEEYDDDEVDGVTTVQIGQGIADGYVKITRTTQLDLDISKSPEAGDIVDIPYTGTEQEILLMPGTYVLEAWGGAGDGTEASGSYVTGTLTVDTPTTYYIYVGGLGVGSSDPGYNGGAATLTDDYGSGGGMTHISTLPDNAAPVNLSGNTDLYWDPSGAVIVAAGGGGHGWDDDGSGGDRQYSDDVYESGLAGIGGLGDDDSATSTASSNHGGGGGGGGGYLGGDGGSREDHGEGGTSYTGMLSDASITKGSETMPAPTGGTQVDTYNFGYARITCVDAEAVTGTSEVVYSTVLTCTDPHHTYNSNWKLYTLGLEHTSGTICTGTTCTDTTDLIFPTGEVYTQEECAAGYIVQHANGTVHLTTSLDVCTYCGEAYHTLLFAATDEDRVPSEDETSCYPYGDSRCWSPCNNPDNHRDYVTTTTTPTGDVIEMGTFVNLDYGFQIYFPNTGDFYGTGSKWSSSTSAERGWGYEDGMDTTEWIARKWVEFPFDVVYDNQTMLAYTQIDLPIDESTYDFYVPIGNSEVANCEIQFGVIAINSPSMAYQDCERNDTRNIDTMYLYGMSLAHYHSADKRASLDVVGRVGALTIEDTTDYRFWNFFKESTATWYIDNIVPNVNLNSTNNIFTDPYDVRGIAMTTTTVGGNTYGLQPEREDLSSLYRLPISPYTNNLTVFQYEPVRLGSVLFADLSTIGNYYGEQSATDEGSGTQNFIYVKPMYYRLDLDTGFAEPVDVYMSSTGSLVLINDFDDSSGGVDSAATRFNLDWANELERRNYRGDEVTVTTDLIAATDWLQGPAGSNWSYGTYNLLNLTQRNRTFQGTEFTYTQTTDPSDLLDESRATLQGQLWHFHVGLPSSATFVYSGESPTQTNIDACTSGNAVILCALEIYAQGQVWTLAYDGSACNLPFKVTPDGDTYDPVITYPTSGTATTEEMPIVAIFSIDKSTANDMKVEGTD